MSSGIINGSTNDFFGIFAVPLEIDNARADRADARAARGEARADRADARASVRFKERDKDRAALAASGGGVRTDLSDLNY